MKTISTDDLKSLQAIEADHVLVNVLAPEHFAQAHIPGSRNVPLESPDFLDRVAAVVDGDKSKQVVVYCANQSCDASPRAARKLTDAGYRNVSDYEGGLEAWQAAGEQIDSKTSAP